MGQLTNLKFLYLGGNKLDSIPAEIKNLVNLKYLYLFGNYFSDSEKEKIKKLLPNCKIYWK